MREHVTELLPLVLVGLVLLAFQLTRGSGPDVLRFLPLPAQVTPTALPQPAVPTTAPPRRPQPTPNPTPAGGGWCDASNPSFVGGIAELKSMLGPSMGQPLECEHSVNDQGDTQQKTTTGLAYYRGHLNVACFTTGWEHWAKQAGGLVHWTGDAVDPPTN